MFKNAHHISVGASLLNQPYFGGREILWVLTDYVYCTNSADSKQSRCVCSLDKGVHCAVSVAFVQS